MRPSRDWPSPPASKILIELKAPVRRLGTGKERQLAQQHATLGLRLLPGPVTGSGSGPGAREMPVPVG
jgi:hypothetical protein